jgi:UTP--glucose-1-phosphate uridylyltransferase
MIDAYERHGGNVIAVEEVPHEDVSSYGVVARGEGPDSGFAITGMVEKPKPADAPSDLIISGRYILQPDIFPLIARGVKGAGGEIQITDAMQTLMQTQPFTGVRYQGRSFDCGNKIGFLTANVVFALDRPDIAEAFMNEIRDLSVGVSG